MFNPQSQIPNPQSKAADAIDAQIIAQFGVKIQPTPRKLPNEAEMLLAELIARRRQLVGNRVAEQNREDRRRHRSAGPQQPDMACRGETAD